jgi:hypothetical protein
VSLVSRRSLLTTAIVLIAGASAPVLPAKAGTDPAAFINNLASQLQIVVGNPTPERDGRDFASCFLTTSTSQASAALFSDVSRGS